MGYEGRWCMMGSFRSEIEYLSDKAYRIMWRADTTGAERQEIVTSLSEAHIAESCRFYTQL
jgi:hypothetical protein